MVTIVDIAKECEVSVATVSYALNGKGHISAEMRLRILETAEKMGYVPNETARNLKNGRSNVISVIIPEVTSFFNNQVFTYMEKEIGFYNLNVFVGCSFEKEASEIGLFEKMISQNPLGIIWFPSKETTEKTFKRIDRIVGSNNVPTLVVYKSLDTDNLKYLEWDIEDGVKQITNYLLDNGLTDVWFFGNAQADNYRKFKYKGYLQAYTEHSLTAPDFSCDIPEDYNVAQEYMSDFLNNGGELPQAIFATNDIVGYGIINALEAHGIKLPQDVSVVGIDGIRFDYAKHKITTVTPNLKNFAEKCIDIIRKYDEYPNDVYVCENNIIKGTTTP